MTLKTIKPLQGHFTKVIKIELKWQCSGCVFDAVLRLSPLYSSMQRTAVVVGYREPADSPA